jgi:hypothetical protein
MAMVLTPPPAATSNDNHDQKQTIERKAISHHFLTSLKFNVFNGSKHLGVIRQFSDLFGHSLKTVF